ncbi:cyclopropane-fatty-acyl-phospholipid synthase family protein [Roseomonas sp. OT10]|uniref:SAM-dependent methyltransferase n=1 Tax=Roseomonas cutis TaxID=2897332 RepID=UPI001E3050AF|nr:cyclopropane-fatty-acyl-phospholipid synthase family protein [Roseomonas sp. OT10]UFN50853.1 cyclopropane-fatty-acyl-phospholipid synthase family protein [Roseomonas sp. OT10]
MRHGPDRRLDAARRLLTHLWETLRPGVPVRLWNGEVVPPEAVPAGGVMLALNSPEAVTRLVRRPRLATVIELVADGDLSIEGGTLLDLAARRGALQRRGLARRLDKRLVLGALLPFLFRGRAGAAGSHAYAGVDAAKDARGRDNKALVQFHYDLSNAFYGLFLDPEMVYSCAYFPDWDASLDDAQRAKLEMTCRKLRLRPGERFLDIGCGWGGLVCHAAQHFGVLAHGVTLSQAQLDFAREKVARLGLQDRVMLELKDYKDLSGEYDKIASIGMFEHVGLDNHAAYFATMRRLLRPRGLLLNHAIARPAKKDLRTFRRKRPEFAALTRYVFPGGELDYIGLSLTNLERHGFEVHDVEGWREHYGRTCRLWTERLYARREAAEEEVGAARTRLWLLYLAGCALAFERGSVGIFQTLSSKRARGPSGLPPTRGDLYR